MGQSVGSSICGRSIAYSRQAAAAERMKVPDLCTSGTILARLVHPVSGKQLVFRHSAKSTRSDKWRMYEVVNAETDSMKCKRTWDTEAELRRTLEHYLAHRFVDITTWNDRMFSRFTERTADHVHERLMADIERRAKG